MLGTISTIILIGSFLGMGIIVVKKIPLLVQLPVFPQKRGFSLGEKIKNKITEISSLKSFSWKKLLHKVLSKLKILALKIETKAEKYLQKMREESKKEKQNLSDNYWQKLKKETKSSSQEKPG